MSEAAKPLATYQDLIAVPEHLIAELVYGTLVTHPRPAPRHAWSSSNLGVALTPPFGHGVGGPGGWVILDEPEIHLEQNVVVPDLAGWRRERLASLPETPYFELAPDWVCEVLSPATQRTDRSDKMPIYAKAGVGHLWLVDPDPRTLEVYQLQSDGHWLLLVTLCNDQSVQQPPFEAISFDLSLLWPNLD